MGTFANVSYLLSSMYGHPGADSVRVKHLPGRDVPDAGESKWSQREVEQSKNHPKGRVLSPDTVHRCQHAGHPRGLSVRPRRVHSPQRAGETNGGCSQRDHDVLKSISTNLFNRRWFSDWSWTESIQELWSALQNWTYLNSVWH